MRVTLIVGFRKEEYEVRKLETGSNKRLRESERRAENKGLDL
jgi:hypothetical protein